MTTGEEEEGGAGASLCCRDVSVGKEKTKGVLHLRSSKLIFLPYKFDNNRVEVDCTRVSSLQVSKTGGSKALLRLSISGGEDVTFDFTGAGDGFSWRDTFKDAAAEIIRSSTSSSSKKQQSGSSGGKGGGAAPEKKAAKEENVEQHRLDASTIFKYFKKYPKLAKVYEEQVPHAMSEQEFWRRFLEAKKLRESSSAESDISTSIMNKSEGKETNNAGHSNSFRASHLALDLTAIENSASLKASASRRYEETCHMERSAIIGE
uniref:BSD domain-containing protein n=1 Tax=Guillardia theta TaxID=55529 RepID=A0A7S4H8E3_GUITH